mmetsp:Transcript_10870/g.28243  ORF Transcript_10870/g.28243 Transcript_10870/m.28243 type:complete len:202 (+) Transcript_10870:527-1132(+)
MTQRCRVSAYSVAVEMVSTSAPGCRHVWNSLRYCHMHRGTTPAILRGSSLSFLIIRWNAIAAVMSTAARSDWVARGVSRRSRPYQLPATGRPSLRRRNSSSHQTSTHDCDPSSLCALSTSARCSISPVPPADAKSDTTAAVFSYSSSLRRGLRLARRRSQVRRSLGTGSEGSVSCRLKSFGLPGDRQSQVTHVLRMPSVPR